MFNNSIIFQEDWKRHTADGRIDSRLAHVVIPISSSSPSQPTASLSEVRAVKWRDVKVGDILILQGDEELPADAVLLASGGVQGPVAYVETAAIGEWNCGQLRRLISKTYCNSDGETNLKLKMPSFNMTSPPAGIPQMTSPDGIP